MRDKEFVVNHNRTKQIEDILLKRGVDYINLMRPKTSIDLAGMIMPIEIDAPGLTPRTIRVSKQLSSLETIAADPTRGHYTLGISSFPSDTSAKQLALYLMIKAVTKQFEKNSRHFYPLWHKLYGFPKDKLRDAELPKEKLPSILIVSNITKDISQMKLEKLRDLLEMYCSIPKIVVMGGIDPITFFSTKLHLSLSAGIYLNTETQPYRKTRVV